MLKLRTITLLFFSLLIYVLLPVESMFQNEKNTVPGIQSETDSVSCSEWRVIQRGVSCVFASDTPLQLDFPKVDLESVLAGNEFLPRAEKVFQLGEIVTAHGQYRNIRLNLRWEPITPDFLQIYLKEYLPYWGHQIPYRLFWSSSYEVCSRGECTEWARFEQKGEILPLDIPDLPSDLAADSNFNGVPAAFWNTHVIP